jgi:group II intron reverse transcriptase/maturase
MMPVLTSERQKLKRTKIRYTEYYDLQNTFDSLYADSLKGKTFDGLMAIIASEENIKLAYRTSKGNKGSTTPGVDGRTIKDLAKLGEDKFVSLIQRQFSWYKPRPVKRVEIPKPDGRTRPLGIPTIVDRMVQQCILQVLEPICEAKFHDHSNGFRPNRGAENAIAQCCRLMQVQNLHYVVDIDIKGFFDNVCHRKLIRQIWELGIRDKTLLCIIKAMLKAQIVMPDGARIIPDKGTPQGGILSPLLSNIVLNELDWWIASQWENIPTHYPYQHRFNKAGTEIKSHTYRALRRSTLKEMHIVRYADDFKIFCRSHADAVRAFEATKLWLKDRLGLDISPEKSAVVNLKKRYSDFLGFKFRVCKKGKKMVVCSHMRDKAKTKAKEKITACVKVIQHAKGDKEQHMAIQDYNATVAGMHNYYQFATRINDDFSQIAQGIKKQMYCRLKGLTRSGKLERGFIKARYGKSRQLRFLNGFAIIPPGYIRTKDALHKKKSVNRYTPEGRAEIHKNLGMDTYTMLWMMRNPAGSMTIEFADNRISLFAAQYGKCAVTGVPLLPHDVYCHHKIPKESGGTDEYGNLILITEAVHILIHAVLPETIALYLKGLCLNKSQLTKLNKLRELAGNPAISQ